MSNIISNLTLVLTSLLTNIGSVITMILNNDLIFFVICLGLSAGVIFIAIKILLYNTPWGAEILDVRSRRKVDRQLKKYYSKGRWFSD